MSAGAGVLAGARRERGLTLVELLVAMALGIVLSAALVVAYLGGKRHYIQQEQMARIQENGRYALRLLGRELAMAGFYGGMPLPAALASRPVSRDCAAAPWALDASEPLGFVSDYPGVSLPRSTAGDIYTCLDTAVIRRGTDMLAVKRSYATASVRRGLPAANLTPGDGVIWYLRLLEGAQPRWEQHRPRELSGAPFNDPRLSLWEASAKVLFIRRYAHRPDDGIPTLCTEVLAGDAVTLRCLVEGVEDMQFEFGIDTDGDGAPNRYSQQPGAGELRRAVTARIYLLLRSLRPLPGYSDQRSYRLGQRLLAAPGDGHARRVFSTTVALRNLGSQRDWRGA